MDTSEEILYFDTGALRLNSFNCGHFTALEQPKWYQTDL